MSEKMISGSAKIREEVKELELEYSDLQKQRKYLEKCLEDVVKRINALDGGPWGRSSGGIIEQRKRELAGAELLEQDEKREPVSVSGHRDIYVLRRITAKSIFLASKGCRNEMRFGLDGRGPYGEIVDVQGLLRRNGR